MSFGASFGEKLWGCVMKSLFFAAAVFAASSLPSFAALSDQEFERVISNMRDSCAAGSGGGVEDCVAAVQVAQQLVVNSRTAQDVELTDMQLGQLTLEIKRISESPRAPAALSAIMGDIVQQEIAPEIRDDSASSATLQIGQSISNNTSANVPPQVIAQAVPVSAN
ncbi:MAG: hypothetical protein AAF222_06050 [Pseudomonadota bacterium]